MAEKRGVKIITLNKKARHDYFVEDAMETGIELFGTEVKSIRQGEVTLRDAYCSIDKGELFVRGMHVSPYEKGNIFNKDPLRVRKLLAHKHEIIRLQALIMRDGYTLVPLSLYFKDARVKVEVGICKGKKLYDKRETLAKRTAGRELERELRERNKQ